MSETYALKGFYEQNGKRGNLESMITVGELTEQRLYGIKIAKFLPGVIIDSNNPTKREVQAEIAVIPEAGITYLKFTVQVNNNDLLNLEYELIKDSIDQDFSGKYQGSWTPREKVVETKITGGPYDGRLGIDFYGAEITKLTPNKEDKKQQAAELTLTLI